LKLDATTVMEKKLTIGLVLNPLAGVGGPAALKGSDGAELYKLATELGYESKVADRVSRTFEVLASCFHEFRVLTVSGAMGADLCNEISEHQPGFDFDVCVEFELESRLTEPVHTIQAAQQLVDAGVDIILFAGGDGTAINIHDALDANARQLVLGIPCGVKMHSGVFAVSPEAAGIVLQQLIEGELVGVTSREVRDIDEAALRAGTVNAQYHGEMWVPEQHRYIQAVKQGGLEVEELVLEEIAAGLVELIQLGGVYIVGAGTTTAAIMDKLNLPNTLLGIDVIDDGIVVLSDASEEALFPVPRCKNVLGWSRGRNDKTAGYTDWRPGTFIWSWQPAGKSKNTCVDRPRKSPCGGNEIKAGKFGSTWRARKERYPLAGRYGRSCI
jgi:predicted polyphosphate/ATP-dependent NAD kinase